MTSILVACYVEIYSTIVFIFKFFYLVKKVYLYSQQHYTTFILYNKTFQIAIPLVMRVHFFEQTEGKKVL